jgi:hypothetical protein
MVEGLICILCFVYLLGIPQKLSSRPLLAKEMCWEWEAKPIFKESISFMQNVKNGKCSYRVCVHDFEYSYCETCCRPAKKPPVFRGLVFMASPGKNPVDECKTICESPTE